MTEEAVVFLAAASETAGNAMEVAAWNMIRNPEIYAKVKAELKEAFPDPNAPINYEKLETLPYFVSILNPFPPRLG